MIDPRVRDDFYGLDHKTFFNNASYAPLLKPVKERIDQYFSGIMQLDVGDAEAKEMHTNIRRNCAKLIKADVDEIEFAINTSIGINLAVLGLDWRAGDEILMPDNEFPSVPYPFRALTDRGVVVKYLPSRNRNFDFASLESAVSPRTRMLAISFVQYFNGFRNDLKELGEFCKQRDIFFLVDAIQGLGACPLDANCCQIDLLSCGAQKWLLSPLGSGFFYVSQRAKQRLNSLSTGWLGVDWRLKYSDLMHFDRDPFADARRYNLGTYPYLQLWGMAAATEYLLGIGVENIFAHNSALIDRLLTYLREDDYFVVNSSQELRHRSQIISIASPANETLHKHLLQDGFMLVYREGGVRVAVNFYNTLDEIDRLIASLKSFKGRDASHARS